MTDRVSVAILTKNSRETIHVSLGEFEGISLCDVRVFATADGAPVATKKGISLRLHLLPELIAGLQRAEAEARQRGLIPIQNADLAA
jgi:Transcriptional Coactivator p15 (PC4)